MRRLSNCIFLLIFWGVFFSFSFIPTAMARDLEEILKSGTLIGAFTNSSQDSINYQLAEEFTKFLGVELEVVKVSWNDNFKLDGQIPDDVETNPNRRYTPDVFKKVDFICNSITLIPWRKKLFEFALTYEVTELLIISKNEPKPRSYWDLKGMTIGVLGNSSYEDHLIAINETIGGGKNGITIRKTGSDVESRLLLTERQVDGIILDSDLAMAYIKDHPDFTVAFPVSSISRLGWGVEKGNLDLKHEIENFFLTIKANGKLDKIFSDALGINYSRFVEIANSYSANYRTKPKEIRGLDEIIKSGRLIVALRDREMVYRPNGPKQFNHALAEEFARYLGVEFEPVITPYFAKYWENDEGMVVKDRSYTPVWFNEFDIAAEILTPMDWRFNKIDIIPFLPDANIIIARKDTKLNSIDDLRRLRGVTLEKSSYVDVLGEYGVTDYYYKNVDNIVLDVINGDADYGIWGNSVYSLSKYPDLEVKLILGDIEMIGWGIKKNLPQLRQKITEFLSQSLRNGLLDRLFKEQTGMTLEMARKFMKIYGEVFQEGDLPFIYYSTKDGLPQEEVLSIYQDKDHYMWFGTFGGAVRYNGREMKLFHIDQGFKDSSIFDIKQDANGKLFFATLKGITIIDDNTVSNILTDVPFKGIHIDRNNDKWFYGDNGVFFFTDVIGSPLISQKIPNLPKNINHISQDLNSDTTYIATMNGVFQVSDNNNRIEKIVDEYSYFAHVDRSGRIWISTSSGLYIGSSDQNISLETVRRVNDQLSLGNRVITGIHQLFDGSFLLMENQSFFHVHSLNQKAIHYDQSKGLTNKSILSIFQDVENNVWLGLAGGLQKLSNRSLRKFHPKTLNIQIYQIFQDLMGRVWINSENGVYYFKSKLKKFNPNSVKEQFLSHQISGILPNQNILVVDSEGIYELDINSLRVLRERRFKTKLPKFERIFISENNAIFLMTGSRSIVYYLEDFSDELQVFASKETSMLYQLIEFQGEIIGGNNYGLARFTDKRFDQVENLGFPVWSLMEEGNSVWIGTEKGLAVYSEGMVNFIDYDFSNLAVNSIYPAEDSNYIWLGTNEGILYFNKHTKKVEYVLDSRDGLSGDEISIDALRIDDRGLLWIGTYHGISILNLKNRRQQQLPPAVYIEKILVNGKVKTDAHQTLKHFQNNLLFELTAPSFVDEKGIEYEFFMKGLDDDIYAKKGKDYRAYYPSLPAGNYEFVYRAKTRNGVWSYYQSYKFKIEKAVWQTIWFRVLAVIVLLLLIQLLVKLRTISFKRKNKELEEQVEDRTREIVKANKKVLDSIEYARRIENSLLPSIDTVKQFLPKSFFYWRPRDVVGGDIYYAESCKNGILVAVIDCTGHGVPGALMAMMATSNLRRIAIDEGCHNPAEILSRLNSIVKTSLHQDTDHATSNDGLDASLCFLDKEANTLTYAGAKLPLAYLSDKTITTIKGDRFSIGYKESDLSYKFTNHQIDIVDGMAFYLFTDGLIDQLGGRKRLPFGRKRLFNLILNNQDKPFEEQKTIIAEAFESYKADNEVQDDVTVVGFKI